MVFDELVKQTLKTKEQIKQEKENAQILLIEKENEKAIVYILNHIKDNILRSAGTGVFQGSRFSETVSIPHNIACSSVYGDPYMNIFNVEHIKDIHKVDYLFFFCFTTKQKMTVKNMDRLNKIFNEVKNRASQDNILISEPFLLTTTVDCKNKKHVIETKKSFATNHVLSTSNISKKYGGGKKWRGEETNITLAVDCIYEIV